MSPYPWRIRYRVLLHNLRAGKRRKFLSMQVLEGGVVRLRSQRRAIHLSNISRWKMYRWGLKERLELLAGQYGVAGLASQLPGRLVLDIGANVGEFSLFALEHGARVIAFEPDPRNQMALKLNLAGSDARIVPKALWKESATLTFYSVTASADSSLIEPTQPVERALEVEAVRLDDALAALGDGPVFLIKADAEGAEPEVLAGACETLRRTAHISIDCGPERQGADTVDTSRALLEAAGFEVTLLPGSRMVLFGSNKAALASIEAGDAAR